MATIISYENRLQMPLNIGSLVEFRRWVGTAEFPSTGRIDFLPHRIEVDMSPEDIYCHGRIKARISAKLDQLADQLGLGDVFVDGTRVVVPAAEMSVEPDVILVTHASIDEGRVSLVPSASHKPGRYIEFEGPPDLIVEIVSDGSEEKDLYRLPLVYYTAGVREYWLVDARGEELVFQINKRGESAFVLQPLDADGFQTSDVFGRRFRLDRSRNRIGNWHYVLNDK